MKIIFKIIKAVVILLLAVFLIMNLPWIMIGVGGMLSPAPPKPEIKYGEFPFKLVYEINGEEITVEDAVICEFDGIGWNEGVGKHRKWKSYLKSDPNETAVLLDADNKRKVYCSVGGAKYYMDEEGYSNDEPWIPHVYRISLDDDITLYSQNQLLRMYNIKLISWEFSDPIVNSFK